MSDVCLRTGHAGQDARPYYRDQDLLPDVFARPYLACEPELAFVVDDGAGPVGYVLGTADTPAFARWFREVWLPPLAPRHPPPTAQSTEWDRVMATALHSPERLVRAELTGYPAHLHINLLPEYQRRGLGKRLMWTFLDALHRRGVPAVHLAYAKVNIPGRQFYKRLGFELLTVADPDPVRYVGRSTSTVDRP